MASHYKRAGLTPCSLQSFLMEDWEYYAQTDSWEGLTWSEWHPLDAATLARNAKAPDYPGLYRIRCRDRAGLIYIGETGVSIRSRLRQLQKAMHYADQGKYQAIGKVG